MKLNGSLVRSNQDQVLQRIHENAPAPNGRYPIRCRAGASSCTINWQGHMRPCVMLTAPETDAFEQGFSNAWKQISEDVKVINTSEKCGTCEYRDLCQSCAAAAFCEEGAFDAVPEYMCRFTHRYVERMRQKVKENKNHENES